MPQTVYIETTIVSYLTAWTSRDLVMAARQRTTREWWDTQRMRFDLMTSQLVLIESGAGDPIAAAERLAVLASLQRLDVSEPATEMADALVALGAIPDAAWRDAVHVGVCAVHGVDYLLTWNFAHLANAAQRDRIDEVCQARGYRPPVICTPDELFEETP